MANGWTGGQYSVGRFVLGALLFVHFRAVVSAEIASDALAVVLESLAFVLCVALALGVRDRIASVALCAVSIGLFVRDPALSGPGNPLFAAVLAALACLPSRPFGSWDARGRRDPDGGWRMRGDVYLAMWIVASFSYAAAGLVSLAAFDALSGWGLVRAAAQIAFGPLALVPRLRPFAWGLLVGVELFHALFVGADGFGVGSAVVQVIIFDPAWVRSRAVPGITWVFYDGACGLCHRTVRFLLAEDAAGERFRFAPLTSEGFARARAAQGSGFDEGQPVPDSVLVQRPGESLLVRSAGVLELAHQLGGLWRLIAVALAIVPMAALNVAYDGVARARRHLFATPEGSCPILPPHLRQRFD